MDKTREADAIVLWLDEDLGVNQLDATVFLVSIDGDTGNRYAFTGSEVAAILAERIEEMQA